MPIAKVLLKSAGPYSQSKLIQSEKPRDESHDNFEKRTWRERMHVDGSGMVFVPPMCFKNCLQEAAKYKGIQIPGKGKSNYTKHFEAGVGVYEPLSLGILASDVAGEWVHVPSDGRPGGTTRVMKCFPLILSWSGIVEFHVHDEIITKDVFKLHMEDAGKFIGIGRFRPRNRGYYGRFSVESIEWMKS